mmetsp:Transcript_1044/g.3065  ORF Transcript_1044/g.3065 Transcript_1044/m.3065 type:complete len:399 (-) Transcript_1044:64-1260(-)
MLTINHASSTHYRPTRITRPPSLRQAICSVCGTHLRRLRGSDGVRWCTAERQSILLQQLLRRLLHLRAVSVLCRPQLAGSRHPALRPRHGVGTAKQLLLGAQVVPRGAGAHGVLQLARQAAQANLGSAHGSQRVLGLRAHDFLVQRLLVDLERVDQHARARVPRVTPQVQRQPVERGCPASDDLGVKDAVHVELQQLALDDEGHMRPTPQGHHRHRVHALHLASLRRHACMQPPLLGPQLHGGRHLHVVALAQDGAPAADGVLQQVDPEHDGHLVRPVRHRKVRHGHGGPVEACARAHTPARRAHLRRGEQVVLVPRLVVRTLVVKAPAAHQRAALVVRRHQTRAAPSAHGERHGEAGVAGMRTALESGRQQVAVPRIQHRLPAEARSPGRVRPRSSR